jgi:hypothetical protein
MLDIRVVLEQTIGLRELEANLASLRDPCTCGPGVHECRACHAWRTRDREHPTTIGHFRSDPSLSATEQARLLSEEDVANLRRQIQQDRDAIRNIHKRLARNGMIRIKTQASLATLEDTLARNLAIRDAYIRLSKKGHFHGTHLLD